MELINYDFQTEAEGLLYKQIAERLDSDEKSTEDNRILFLSVVASGKTKMASAVCNQIADDYDDVAFLFFSPSLAQLHNNAYNEIKAYGWGHMEVMTLPEMVLKADANGGSVPAGSFTAIGWSDVNKSKKNVQMKIGEKATFASIMKTNKTRIVCLYDEGHLNQDRQAVMKEMVRPFAEVIITATSKKDQLKKAKENFRVIQVDPQKVIDEGKIKSHIIVNDAGMEDDDPDSGLKGDGTWEGLIRSGLHRREWLEERYASVGMDVNALMVIQLPNDDKNETKDDLQTKTNAEIVKDIVKEQGIADDDIIIWLAERHDVDPNQIKNTKHKVLIVKVACATGWNCPRAMPLVKLREPSQSDTLDEQTMGRFLRTTDPTEWLANVEYQNDEYLNAAFVYTASEEYDASLKGYSIRDAAYVQTMREEHREQWEKVHLVKVVPGKKYLGAEDKIIRDMVEAFNENFPSCYSTYGGNWVFMGDLDRRVAQYDQCVADMMNDIAESGKSITSGHDRVDMSDEKIEDYVWADIKRTSSLRQHRHLIEKAITNHLEENLCYNLGSGGSFLSAPDEDEQEQRMEKRNDFFRGIYANFNQFAEACADAIENHIEYNDDTVWDGPEDSIHRMYVPPMETFTGINLVDTPEKSNFAFDKMLESKASKPEREMVTEFMSKKMDTWFKNGTHDKDSFLIAYKDENNGGAHCKFFPDFISIKDRTLFLIETKGYVDAACDHAIESDKDKCKAKAIYGWLTKYAEKSVDASEGIDKIVFGIAKKINGDWRIYQGDGKDYDDFTSENWKLLSDIVG